MKTRLIVILFFCTVCSSFAQTADQQPLDSAINNVLQQVLLFPQEKIYLQTDKPYYISGENVFFRVFLLNAFSHQPADFSRYVYVELINPENDLVTRLQIRPENNMHYGTITLPEDLEEGNYRIRAYTRFMENMPEEYFYHQWLYIADPGLTEKERKAKQTPPAATGRFNVSFYPEGGNLIAGQVSTVAFKALDSNGNPLLIQGEVYNAQNEMITEFTSFHEGMGQFAFTPIAGENYYALCFYEDKNIKVNLPKSQTNALALKASWRQDKLWVQLNKPTEILPPNVYLVIHTGGLITYAAEWDFNKEVLVLDKVAFPSGISHLLLLTEDFQPISERLVFALNEDWISPTINSNKTTYRAREQVKMDVDFQNDSIFADFAISVTEDQDIKVDTTQNILTTILLTSELRGYIHNPAYYFQDKRESKYAADLLMLTHCWKRYDIPKAMRGDFQFLTVQNEESQSFTGLVRGGFFLRPYKDSKVKIISTNSDFSDIAETDEKGRFMFNDFEFPDSTEYIIQALNKRGRGSVELFVDHIEFPRVVPIKQHFAQQKEQKLLESELFNDYVVKANQKYTIENGIRMIHLGEVTVRGTRRRQEDGYRSHSTLRRVTTATGGGADMVSLIRRSGISVVGHRQEAMLIRGRLVPISDELRNIDMFALDAIGVDSRGMPVPMFKPFDERFEELPKYNIARKTPLGYHTPVEFYSPKYDTPEARSQSIPDLRSIIYWKPDVITDSASKTSLDFYTADSQSTYSAVIEGVSSDGKLIYQRAEAFIKVE